MTNKERAREFVRVNYSNATIYTMAERELAYLCYLNGLIDKDIENSISLTWRDSGEGNIFAIKGEPVLARCIYNGDYRYEVGFYHESGVRTYTTLYEHLAKEWSLIPAQGWHKAPKTMPADVKVALFRSVGGNGDHLYRVVASELNWTLELTTGREGVEYLKIA